MPIRRGNCSIARLPLESIMGRKKVVDVQKYYNSERLRPTYETFERQPLFIMTSEG